MVRIDKESEIRLQELKSAMGGNIAKCRPPRKPTCEPQGPQKPGFVLFRVF